MSLADLSEGELVDRAVGGDFSAFEEIVERHQDQAYRLAWGMVRDDAEAQDVVQDAFLNIYRKLDTFEGDAKLGSWIYRIVVNAALMRIRKTSRRRETSIEEAGATEPEEGAFSTPVTWEVQADVAAENRELRDQILAAIDELEPRYQAVFLLREIEGLPLQEIADILELSEGGVKTRLHRARLFLQAALEPYLKRNESIVPED